MIGCRTIPAAHGGLERAVEELSAELVHHGHQVEVLVDRAAFSRHYHRDILVRSVPSWHSKHLHTLTQVAASTPSLLAERPDVAHFHGCGPGMFSSVARALRVPTVLTVQGVDWQ